MFENTVNKINYLNCIADYFYFHRKKKLYFIAPSTKREKKPKSKSVDKKKQKKSLYSETDEKTCNTYKKHIQ
jgi:hypothetical protein